MKGPERVPEGVEFFTRESVKVQVRRVDNPRPKSSFGFASGFYAIEANARLRKARLSFPLDLKLARDNEIDPRSLRLFRWDDQLRRFRLIRGSTVDAEGKRISGIVTRSGVYTAIGLSANPWVRETVGIFVRLCPWLRAGSRLRDPIRERICQLILCPSPVLRDAVRDPVKLGKFGLPPYPRGFGGNICEYCTGLDIPDVDGCIPEGDIIREEECSRTGVGEWTVVPGDPQVTMMHAALLPGTSKMLFWGYTLSDQSRLWDSSPSGGYSTPSNQPGDTAPVPLPVGQTPESYADMWSAEHAFLNTPDGHLLVNGGYASIYSRKQSLTFDPATGVWERKGSTADGRFYATTLTLADGRALTLFGNDLVSVSRTIEAYDPSTGTWSVPKSLPSTFNYLYYPWTYLLPGGDLFIAGPQGVTRRFDWTAATIIDDPSKTWTTNVGDRGPLGGSQNGSSVLLPLGPPHYEPRVLIVGGEVPGTEKSTEIIDLSSPSPSWVELPDLNEARDSLTAVLLPDGRVLVVGGRSGAGGPVEIFDSEDPGEGWRVGPSMTYERGYHSSAILLSDGSILVGGDPSGPGGPTPHERYFPDYCFKPRPVIAGAPASASYGSTFTIQTPNAPGIGHVVLMRPGAVTHGFNMSQRLVGCAIASQTPQSVQVQVPPNGNIAPPGYYLLFLLDVVRVPSVATWIRIT